MTTLINKKSITFLKKIIMIKIKVNKYFYYK
ncbi:hypothetical protein SAMN04488082_11147 [Desulfomicrobium apsheronum]|uniref:Uncharacterized protein n=1 Tax=Desulfomicrobium apsheronum TaxID=52560 RepID=A0A1I3VX70_9BACT|nr:hypothetical protein SAMN04488082_11147 [Desulfomicrobium apsheronum]